MASASTSSPTDSLHVSTEVPAYLPRSVCHNTAITCRTSPFAEHFYPLLYTFFSAKPKNLHLGEPFLNAPQNLY